MKVRPTNSRVQRIHLLRFPMTASWIHRTLWQSSLTSTPPEVGDPSWITKLMVGESICGSLSLLSYSWDLCIVMAFSISPLRLGCYRFVVAILKLWTFLETLLGHFSLHLYRFEAQSIEGFVKVKTMSESLVSKTCTDSFLLLFQKLRITLDSWWLRCRENLQYLRCFKTIHEGS